MNRFIDAVAVSILENWCYESGLKPSGGWDPDDPNCVRNHGPHRVWTVCARSSKPLDEEALRGSFECYMTARNLMPGAVLFQPYDLDFYDCPCGCGHFVYASIYQ